MEHNDYITAAQWLTEQIQEVLSDTSNCLEGDPSVELAYRCYDRGMELAVKEDPSITLIPDEFLRKALMIGELYWETACDLLAHSQLKMNVQKLGFVYTMSLVYENLQPECADQTAVEENDAFSIGMKKAVENIITERFEYLTDQEETGILPQYEIPSDEEIDKILEGTDQNLVSRFFYLFKELKVFHVDPSRYDTEEEVNKQKEMLAIFYKIFKMGS